MNFLSVSAVFLLTLFLTSGNWVITDAAPIREKLDMCEKASPNCCCLKDNCDIRCVDIYGKSAFGYCSTLKEEDDVCVPLLVC
ncbi:hypothetical protein ES319_A08G107800v1 [Gossypium barbadense]|uniref:Bifunctional inhibitor/plant lipid transfer protein/seed storage helical domain-containing protein n=1 Tax=Gossypium barbadense TaxID=3634 RepID=A0A5J5UNN0_GOSBA|nr:hypothetical protein ES319_A08G107800v1 [Gossypium barbadense]